MKQGIGGSASYIGRGCKETSHVKASVIAWDAPMRSGKPDKANPEELRKLGMKLVKTNWRKPEPSGK